MKIRLESPEDYRVVEELTREAFWNVVKPDEGKHYDFKITKDDTVAYSEEDEFNDIKSEVNKNMPNPMTKDEYKQMMYGFFPMLKRWR